MSALETLLRSDVDYFRLGAEIQPLTGGGDLYWMAGCQGLAAGCVAVDVPRTAEEAPEPWIAGFEEAVRAVGAPLARLYLQSEQPRLGAALASRGYAKKVESAFLSAVQRPAPTVERLIRPVETARDWEEALQVFQEGEDGPDGYANRAEMWLELIQRKCGSGQLSYGLIEDGEGVAGTVGWMVYPGMIRLKNLALRPSRRGNGTGAAVVEHFNGWSGMSGRLLGMFGIEASAGAQLYAKAGMVVAGSQEEWSKWLVD
jgi:hypothetical protein